MKLSEIGLVDAPMNYPHMIPALIITSLFFGMITAFISGQRGYNVLTWYMIGLVVGPLGLLASLLPKRAHELEAHLSFEPLMVG